MLQLRTFHAKNKLKEAPQPTQNKFVSQITKTQTLTVTNRRNSKGEFTLNLRELSFSCLCRVSSTGFLRKSCAATVYTQAATRSTNPKQKHHVHKRTIPNSKQNKTQIQSKMTRHTQAKHTQFRAKRDRDKTTSIPVHKRNTQFEVKRVTNPNKTTRHTSEIHTQFGQNEPYIMSFPGTPLLQLCSRLLQL